MNIKVSKAGFCERCSTYKKKTHFIDKNALPIWYDADTPVYTVPPELSGLSSAEKLLIQRIAPFVPLHHIKKGTFGLSGHVCAFEQDVNSLLVQLPRRHDDVSILKVLKTIKTEIGCDESNHTRAFLVRKSRVLKALIFLKEHNREYKDIQIDMTNLDWIDGDEGQLDGQVLETEEILTRVDDMAIDADIGPAPQQANYPSYKGDDIKAFGYIDTGGQAALSGTDSDINKELQDSVAKSPKKKQITVDWPQASSTPVNEFGEKRLFAMAFPWLFPGGIGDAKDSPIDINKWGKQLLYYEDGRFARDKIFCFYVLNYIIRQRNSSSGRWFVNTFQHQCPDNLEELKSAIQKGNTSFVNCLTYFNQRVKGSSSYWFKKRSELYTWINHHVEAGNGAPMFFITLSCAEYFWKDVIELLRQRMSMAGEDTSQCYVGSPKLVEIANDYSVVIQEYFQKRVEIWLKTVGKDVFGIENYWVRFEFAPGRGQIHAHLLAIPKDQSIYKLCHVARKEKDGETKRAEYLAEWASEKFGLTASVDQDFDSIVVDSEENPVKIRFSDVGQCDESLRKDVQGLMKFCQVHDCSGFCMRETQSSKW